MRAPDYADMDPVLDPEKAQRIRAAKAKADQIADRYRNLHTEVRASHSHRAMQAAAELLIRAGLVTPDRPWLDVPSGTLWFERIPDYLEQVHDGMDRRILEIAASLAGDLNERDGQSPPSFWLRHVLILDAWRLDLVLAALAWAAAPVVQTAAPEELPEGLAPDKAIAQMFHVTETLHPWPYDPHHPEVREAPLDRHSANSEEWPPTL